MAREAMLHERNSPLEALIESVLDYATAGVAPPDRYAHEVEKVLRFDARAARVIVLGGGTGMSNVVGGPSAAPDWPERPFVGLKEEFCCLDVVACTTDDGGSTGLLLQRLPMIGIGDLRKACVSMVRAEGLRRAYGLDGPGLHAAVAVIQRIFNHRFGRQGDFRAQVADLLCLLPPELRESCPSEMAARLRAWGAYAVSSAGLNLDPAGHCLGNLLLTAAVFEAAGGRVDRAPGLAALRRGLDAVAEVIGAPPGRLHPATATPGQLIFRYANGVETYGQRKAAVVRRGVPVQRVRAEFAGPPTVSEELLQRIAEADMIVYAPGSVYSSVIPVLLVEPVAEAIRSNRRALKVLGANFWIQEGETDLSLRNEARGFLVSELVEAYDDNVPGGAAGLFDVVLCANLESIPGHILRNYALEGKRPIHLDRAHVEGMGLRALEATVFSHGQLAQAQILHHDASRFALALKTLWYAQASLPRNAGRFALRENRPAPRYGHPLNVFLEDTRRCAAAKRCNPSWLADVLVELAWENRDLRPRHWKYFDEVRLVRADAWRRSTEWDTVLGYFDPEQRALNLHESLAHQPDRLRGDLLVAWGESLLGNYIAERRWKSLGPAARCYEIRLRPAAERVCLLSGEQLARYLRLARMVPDEEDPLVYRLAVSGNEGFIPCGLLFGLLFAWYLNNELAPAIEYEMALLAWPASRLMPCQVIEQGRRRALVAFFREEVFGHPREGPGTETEGPREWGEAARAADREDGMPR